MSDNRLMTAQVWYEDNTSSTIENVLVIDYLNGDFITIEGKNAGIIARKGDVKRVFFVRKDPAPEVNQEEVMKAEDA